MALTLHDITPIGLYVATLELLDTRRFQAGFCDSILMKEGDNFPELISLRRELNSSSTQSKFLEGHKTAIISNIDKILTMTNRYQSIDSIEVGKILKEGKEIIKRVFYAGTFEQIAGIENDFKREVVLPINRLFIELMKRSKVSVI